MKTKLLTMLLIFIVALPLSSAPPYRGGKSAPSKSAVVDNDTYINVNRILMFVTNHGNFARDLSGVFGHDAGTFFPYSTVENIQSGLMANYCLYAGGLWVGGIVNGETRVIISEYSDEYVPGPMIDSTFAPDKPEYKVYKLYRDSVGDNANQDYKDWPIDQGAPFVVVGNDTLPELIGDQMLWSVCNDADPDQHTNQSGYTEPLGLEVRQTTFAFDRQDALGNVIFVRYRVYNKGENTIENCLISLWCDPDLGEYTDDLVGCDTTMSLGFVYNSDNDDAGYYEDKPPSLGIDFFQGPLVYTGDPADQAKMWDTTWDGYVNMGMTSFNKYINGTDPNDYTETYNYMQGLSPNGDPYEYNGQTLLYMHSGDPTKGLGDLDIDPADRRWMQTTGPITFAPGDSTEILAAIVVAVSTNRLTSISLMKYYDRFAQDAYDRDFELLQQPAKPEVTVTTKDQGISLFWNDASEVDNGSYPFEGYIVWQGESPTGPWTQVAAFDLQNGIEDIFDEVFDPVSGVSEIRLVKNGEELGIQRHIFIEDDHILGGPLRNVKEYYFKVEAYTFDPGAGLGLMTLTDASTVSVRPQRPIAEHDYDVFLGDTLEVAKLSGGSGGEVIAIVVDQTTLTSHAYRVVFQDTTVELGDGSTVDRVWHLIDDDTGEPVLEYQTNQSGDEDYEIVDGLLVKVVGPAFNVVAIDEVADADGPLATPDNVMYSLNSTGDWYVSSDQGGNYSRMNWRDHIGTYDWEFRFTSDSSEYFDWISETKWTDKAPFEVWNVGIATPEDPSDDVRIQFAIIDDDESGGWSWGDLIYPFEREYLPPLPDPMEYTWDDDFLIGRIQFNDASEALTAPAEGTVVRFTTAKVNTEEDVFTFDTDDYMTVTKTEDVLDNIRVVPNPFYLYGPYDPTVGAYEIKWHNLPAECRITIYNLAGEYIREIEKDDPTTSIASWDAQTENGMPVASGIYLWVVDAPGFGQKIGKMAVFTEVEVLKTY